MTGAICAESMGFSTGPRHTVVPSTPPFRSTRAASRQPATRSAKRKMPNDENTASNEPSENPSAWPSCTSAWKSAVSPDAAAARRAASTMP